MTSVPGRRPPDATGVLGRLPLVAMSRVRRALQHVYVGGRFLQWIEGD
jgi:hypothetical protein